VRPIALQEKHRNTIYTEFSKTLGEEATQALLSQFPARDVDEAATKADLALVRGDLDVFRAEIRLEIAALGDKMTTRMLTITGLELAGIGTLLALLR